MATPADGTYAVVWPRGPKAGSITPLAQRPASLEGKKIAFLWDYLFRGDEIFPMLASELSARYPGVEFVGHETFGSTHGDEEHEILAGLPDKLRALEVDAVISGMGC